MRRSPLALFLFLTTSSVIAQPTLDVTTTPITNVTADALASLPNGTVWSVNMLANTVSQTTPGGETTTYPVPTPNAGLTGITAGPDGNVWVTESIAKQIARITSDGLITEFPTPANAAAPQRIFPGPNNTLWATSCPFLEPLFFGCDNIIVVTPFGSTTLGAVFHINAPGQASFGPDRCALGSDGNEWCFGYESVSQPSFSSQFKIARIDSTGRYAGFSPPTAFQGEDIVAGPDMNIWCTWQVAGLSTGVMRVMPSGAITEFPIMTGNPHSEMFGLAVGADKNLYFVDRQTSFLYELVLPLTTGMPTIRSGVIQLGIPEDMVPVLGGVSTSCPPGGSFVIRSGGSPPGEIVWVATPAPAECTDLIAEIEALRLGGNTNVTALCHDSFESHDDAESAVLSIELPAGSQVSLEISAGVFFANGICEVSGSEVHCDAPLIEKGFDFQVRLSGVIGAGDIFLSCDSVTPEEKPSDNDDEIEDFDVGLPPVEGPPLQVGTRFSFSVETKP